MSVVTYPPYAQLSDVGLGRGYQGKQDVVDASSPQEGKERMYKYAIRTLCRACRTFYFLRFPPNTMTRLLSILCLSTIAIAAPSQPKHHKPPGYGGGSGGLPSVSIKNGTVTGVHNANYNQDFFLGVPYAQPPVGENRFRNPQSINSTFASAIAANAYAPLCVGYGGDDLGYEASEDCLYLNVVRPAGYEKESLPVGVWIHGGGLYMGGSADKRYNLSFIVENSVAIGKPIIGVSIGYRLSGWGFLASQEVVGAGQTNIGFRDQRLALHWLQENIAPFGGDKEKVTVSFAGYFVPEVVNADMQGRSGESRPVD